MGLHNRARLDSELLERLKELVREAHADYDKWKYRKGELEYMVAVVCKLYNDLTYTFSKERANQIINEHSRLAERVFQKLQGEGDWWKS